MLNVEIKDCDKIINAKIEDGVKGDKGLSAYEVAVSEGFSGTKEEWLESLVGPPVPVAQELGDDPDLAVSQKLLKDSIDSMEQSNSEAVSEAERLNNLSQQAASSAAESESNASASAESANSSALSAAQSASESEASAELAAEKATETELNATRAETARDAAFVNADVYPDVAAGLAAVADGEQFQVVEGDEIVRYRRDSATTQTEMARYPASEKVDRLVNDLPPMVRQAPDVSRGLAVTKPREQFIVSSNSGTVLYETFGNLFDPLAVVEDRYISPRGVSLPASGWAHSDYIRVNPGTLLSISTNTTRRKGVAFYTEDKVWAGFYSASSFNPLSLEVPANAAYVRYNVKAPTIPQPTEIMVNEGGQIPYAPFGVNEAKVVNEILSKGELSQVLDYYTSDNLFVASNVSENIYISSTNYNMQTAMGWSSLVVPATEGDVFTIYSPSGIPRREGAAFFATVNPSVGDTSVDGSYNSSTGAVTLTAPAGTQSLVVNVTSPRDPLPGDLMIVRGALQIPYIPGGELMFVKRSSIRPAIDGSGSETKKLSFTFNGAEGDTSSIVSESGLTRQFIAVPMQDPLSLPARFNIRADLIDGVELRNSPDDIAPDHIDDTTVGANHGYFLGECTAVAHGKVAGDCGSVWASGGNEYVLADVRGANTLLIARRDSNAAVPSGTFTHVSGATNTENIVVTAAKAKQWYPPHKNRSLLVLADGSEVTPSAEPISADKVQFIEQADILARADIIAAWIADGGMPAGYEPNAPASIAQTLTYEYDKRGQLTIARDWLTVKDILISDLMGLQFTRKGTEEKYIIPGSLPFTYNGETVDYSMGEPADLTLAWGNSIPMNSAKLQASGEYAHRVLVVYPNAIFAIGLLPVGDAAYDVRRDRTSDRALEIRGNTGKLYFRVLDNGDHTSVVGDQYSAIGYRHILPRSTERTAFYAVEGGGATWVYADWHNKDGLDRLPIDEQYPELIGRSFEVIEARNVTAKGGIIAGPISAIVSAATSSATLILKVT